MHTKDGSAKTALDPGPFQQITQELCEPNTRANAHLILSLNCKLILGLYYEILFAAGIHGCFPAIRTHWGLVLQLLNTMRAAPTFLRECDRHTSSESSTVFDVFTVLQNRAGTLANTLIEPHRNLSTSSIWEGYCHPENPSPKSKRMRLGRSLAFPFHALERLEEDLLSCLTRFGGGDDPFLFTFEQLQHQLTMQLLQLASDVFS
jgi:hypothetical protein